MNNSSNSFMKGLVLVIAVFVCSLGYAIDVDTLLKKPSLRILELGNSYTNDATRYLPQIIQSCGVDASDVCLYTIKRSSSSFKDWVNIYNDADKAQYSISRIVGGLTINTLSGLYGPYDGSGFRSLLSQDEWDLIIIHQRSLFATDYNTWIGNGNSGFLNELLNLLKVKQPQAVIGTLVIHSYSSEYENNTEQSSYLRWQKIVRAVQQMTTNHDIDLIIPYGTAVQNLRESHCNNIHDLTRDGAHLAYGLPCYAASGCYYETVFAPRFGVSFYGNTFRLQFNEEEDSVTNIPITDENAIVAQESVRLAMIDWRKNYNPEGDTDEESKLIAFYDDVAKSLCVAAWDTDGDGELSMGEAAAVTDIGRVFTGQSKLKTFDELQYFTSLTGISPEAFKGCKYLRSVVIPDGVASIGESAFYGCYNLVSVSLPEGLETISANAFYACKELPSVGLPQSLVSIGTKAFYYCQALSSVVIPNSVTELGDNAFKSCSVLSDVTMPAVLPSSVLPASVATLRYTYVLPDEYSVFSSPNSLDFSSADGLEANVVSSYAARQCGFTSVTDVPASTGLVLRGVAGTEYVLRPGSGTALGAGNLLHPILESSTVQVEKNGYKNYGFGFSGGEYLFSALLGPTVFPACSAYLSLPSDEAYGVRFVWLPGAGAPVEVIDFADGLAKSLCVAAWDTDGDGELSLVEAAAVTDIGRVFTGQSKLKTFDELQYFTSLTGISPETFKGCKYLRSVVVPESVVSIGESAFYGCYKLVSVSLPEGLETISANAFYACKELPSVCLPQSLVSIGTKAFYYCQALSSVVIPNSVTELGANAFKACSVLSEVTMPAVLSSLGLPAAVSTLRYTYVLPDEYSVFSSPNALDFSSADGLEANVVSSYADSQCGLTSVTDVPAATGLLLHGESGTEYFFMPGANVQLIVDNFLVAVLTPTTILSEKDGFKNYCFGFVDGSHLFCELLESAPFPIGSAYLSLSSMKANGVKNVWISGADPPIFAEMEYLTDNRVKESFLSSHTVGLFLNGEHK